MTGTDFIWIAAALWLFAVPGGLAVMYARGEDPRSVSTLASGLGRGLTAYLGWLALWAATLGLAAPGLVWLLAGR